MSVDVIDPKGKVASIELSSPQMPGMVFTLNDKGKEGDRQAGDGTWSLAIQLPAPEQVPAGEFHLEFKAMDKDGLPIKVKGPKGEKEDLKTEAKLTILRPEGE